MKSKLILFFLISFLFGNAYANNLAAQQNLNKRIVVAFYNQAVNKKDFAAASHYLGPYYTQHNPTAHDGAQGLNQFIQFLQDKYPNAHSEIKRVFAEGNFVILHVHSIREPGTKGRAIFDLFRLEKSKIVEHWDTVQDIPETAQNTNGMF